MNMRVLVTGASGFVGSSVSRDLIAAGHFVSGISRSLPVPDRCIPGVRYYAGVDLCDASTIPRNLFDEIDVIVHLVGIIRERAPRQTFQRVHVQSTEALVSASANAPSLKKIVYVSAIGASSASPSAYSRSKAAAEDVVTSASKTFVILRPSIILGPGGEFSKQMSDLVLHGGLPWPIPFPVIPVPGNGHTMFQPVSVGDLGRCIVIATQSDVADNTVIEIGGATRVSFNEILDSYARRLNVHKAKLHAPIPLLMALAPLFEILPNPPVTRDQLRNLSRDNICDSAEMKRRFQFEPLAFEQAMDLALDCA